MADGTPRFDPYGVLQALDRHRVKYVVIGGFARVLQGTEELTRGLDIVPSVRGDNLRRLDEALDALSQVDPRKGRVIELRFFGGLSTEETAAILDVSTKTVIRDWTFAKAWLQREMTAEARAR